jgi:polynucleotide 5'-kinase involved in rRNA processing
MKEAKENIAEELKKGNLRVETEEEEENLEPPFVIVVQGSHECGKSTLVKSLVQHFTK